MIRTSRKNLVIVKSYFQLQILIETIDELYNETSMELKAHSKNYLNFLKIKAEPIINTMFQSNPEVYQKVTNSLRSHIDSIDQFFEIID